MKPCHAQRVQYHLSEPMQRGNSSTVKFAGNFLICGETLSLADWTRFKGPTVHPAGGLPVALSRLGTVWNEVEADALTTL